MKLVQFWKNNTPALGLQTPQGIVDVQAEAARRGVSAPGDMAQAIALGGYWAVPAGSPGGGRSVLC